MGWKWGLPALQLPSLAKWDALPKGDLSSTCLFKESIPAIPVRNSKHPLPGRSNFLTAAARSRSLHYGCIMPISSLQLQEKDLSHAEKQRVWSRSWWSVVSKICCPVTNAGLQQSTFVESRDCAFSNSGLEVEAASLAAAEFGKMRRTAERRFVGHVCFRNPFLPFLLGISKHPLPGRSNFLTAAARSTPLCIRVARESPLQFPLQNGWSRVKNKLDIHLVLRVGGVWPPQFCRSTLLSKLNVIL